MIEPNEQLFFRRLHALAVMSGFELDEHTVALYDNKLLDVGYRKLAGAVEEIIATRSSRDPFPSIREIREVATKAIPERAESDAISTRIFKCFNSKGYAFPWDGGWDATRFDSFDAALIHEVGEVGAHVIKQMGGYSVAYGEWRDTRSLQTFRAQLRDLISSTIARRERGALPELPATLAPPSGEVKALIDDVLKKKSLQTR